MTIYNMDDELRRAWDGGGSLVLKTSYFIFVKCKYKLIKTPNSPRFIGAMEWIPLKIVPHCVKITNPYPSKLIHSHMLPVPSGCTFWIYRSGT